MTERGPPQPPRTTLDLSLDADFSAALNRRAYTVCPQLAPRLLQTYSQPSRRAGRIPPYGVHVVGEERKLFTGREQFLEEAKRLLREASLDSGIKKESVQLEKLLRKKKVAVKFEWKGDVQSSVFLVGSFNDWSVPVPMCFLNGQWERVLRLSAGEYDYKFVVDGEWAVDKSRLCAVAPGLEEVNRLIIGTTKPN